MPRTLLFDSWVLKDMEDEHKELQSVHKTVLNLGRRSLGKDLDTHILDNPFLDRSKNSNMYIHMKKALIADCSLGVIHIFLDQLLKWPFRVSVRGDIRSGILMPQSEINSLSTMWIRQRGAISSNPLSFRQLFLSYEIRIRIDHTSLSNSHGRKRVPFGLRHQNITPSSTLIPSLARG